MHFTFSLNAIFGLAYNIIFNWKKKKKEEKKFRHTELH